MGFIGENCITGLAATAILCAKVNSGVVDVTVLSWGKNQDMKAISRDYDLILGSDVVYHDHLYEPLIEMLRFLFLGGGKKIAFVMAHLISWKRESVFFKRAKKLFDGQIIHPEPPSNGSRIGMVVYLYIHQEKIVSKRATIVNQGSCFLEFDNVIESDEPSGCDCNDPNILKIIVLSILALFYYLFDVLDRLNTTVSNCTTANQIWDALVNAHECTSQVRKFWIALLFTEYEAFKMKEKETFHEMMTRLTALTNELTSSGKVITVEE
ncbi:hypothetical protein CQW23_01350 [Capsicum baccatum]|uniref:Uncharacterized protein n=1 Tax=Capsicum baccatum TaxID=33114 RepID=A0A2G2XNB9_CAPBA|nr:hypothetical protein CQW23_01350 [Capsicum baccatum]